VAHVRRTREDRDTRYGLSAARDRDRRGATRSHATSPEAACTTALAASIIGDAGQLDAVPLPCSLAAAATTAALD
jgi:hypothetical protein